jgi:hypothetical protein
MNRVELGERMQQWHSSMHDPVYAVGSFYFSNQVYPDKAIVEHALRNMTEDIEKFQKMLRGEKVSEYKSFVGAMVDDVKAWAGYTDDQLTDNVRDLTEIVSELKRFMKEDYK